MLSTFHQSIHSVVNWTKYGITISLPVSLRNQLPAYHLCSSDFHSNLSQSRLLSVHFTQSDFNWTRWLYFLGFKMCFLAYLLLHFTFLYPFFFKAWNDLFFQVSKAKPLCIAFILYISPWNTPTFESINYILPSFAHGLLCAISKTVLIKFIQGLR